MDLDKILEEIKKQILALLGKNYKEFKPELEKDLDAFLQESKQKLARWILLLADKSLTKEEFEWLLKSQTDLIALKSLQTAGITKIRLNNIKNSIIKTIFQTVILAL